MNDLYLAIVGMTILGFASFFSSRRLAAGLGRRRCDLLALLTVLCICAYIRWLWNDMRLVRLLPVSNLIIVGNWFLPLIGILAGLAWERIADSRWRRWTATVLLFTCGMYATVQPVLGKSPVCDSRWSGQYCMQTTTATCSAAAAATLLNLHHIESDEQEMADLCLTRDGTTWKGLYRGLALKTAGTAWRVEVIDNVEDALPTAGQPPVILCARLPAEISHDPRLAQYHTEWGWIPGTSHSVVVLQPVRDGQFLVHDPSIGIEVWTQADIDLLVHGKGLRLSPAFDGVVEHRKTIVARSWLPAQ
ncbi:MAG: hypothetical protein DWQ34_17545 [Planctomycetota bacterium]|nr:MAG: hypothetical protein DWQ29_13860 [Planctomycetota bacterium]REJ90382.1 MAG: hypothetical protein DWQ34_17545 [Planctomycetota bacterium]REK28867.1 MAG: hypothetical protein DWQ41_04765 [Planctomycetota bacterium]REK39699.1 MAG: hypothetical protein DWQ45_02180 [Planctomycetota bacterium]